MGVAWQFNMDLDEMEERRNLKRVSGTSRPNIVCKFCAHEKTWHREEGPCRVDQCDCEAWDYGVNVEEVDGK